MLDQEEHDELDAQRAEAEEAAYQQELAQRRRAALQESLTEQPTGAFGVGSPNQGEAIYIDTGRGTQVEAHVGDNFEEKVNYAADQVNYGGYFRVFINGVEVVDPTDAPPTIQKGMRIAITAYDKVG